VAGAGTLTMTRGCCSSQGAPLQSVLPVGPPTPGERVLEGAERGEFCWLTAECFVACPRTGTGVCMIANSTANIANPLNIMAPMYHTQAPPNPTPGHSGQSPHARTRRKGARRGSPAFRAASNHGTQRSPVCTNVHSQRHKVEQGIYTLWSARARNLAQSSSSPAARKSVDSPLDILYSAI